MGRKWWVGLAVMLFGVVLVGGGRFPAGRAQHVTAAPAGGEIFFDTGQALGGDVSHGVALGDLDGDGDDDAFVANGSGGANRVWLNDGNGWFSDSGQSLGSADSEDVALGDVDGDTDLDAVVANGDGANRVWLNDGSGQFPAGYSFGSGTGRGVALGDLDGDTDLDAFVANSGGNTVWLNDGGVLSDSGQSLGTANGYDVALGDVDGDDDLDAYVANGLSGAQPDRVWLNDGNGTFTDSGQDIGAAWSYGVALGDVDGDDDLDAVTASWFPQGNKVFLNDGNGTFTDSGQSLGGAASLGVALADVDGDDDLDGLVANNVPDPGRVWLNDGNGTFSSDQGIGGDTTAYLLAPADLDGDLDPDLFVANFGANAVWLNGVPGVPNATFDVSRETNEAGDDVTYWATAGNALLPVMLGQPAPQPLDVHVRIETDTSVMTETIPYATGAQIQFLNLVNPDPDPDEAFDLSLRVGAQGSPPGPVTDQLVLVFVDAGQGQSDCYLCFVEWLARLLGFNPGFNDLFHLDLEEQQASPQWDYYAAMFGLYEPEITGLVAEHPSLLWPSLQMLNGWTPAAQSLAAGNGDQVTISQAMMDDVTATFDGLKEEAGPGLQAAIQREQDALDLPSLVGMDVAAAWDEITARRPISQTYVTVILKE